ncbi:terminase large subunit [Aeromonas media]|uniref:terminase large subunit n=1 Tax=Aeromonas media TaxID=651 RepID=UPI002953675E|nr:terminase TerL endonuclease subunit [Aeromonas media]WOQ15178.1 terminase TerL endonuclease subunit [Aeromonas media]
MFKYDENKGVEQFNFIENEPDLVDYRGTPINSPYFQGWQSAFVYVHQVLTGIRHSSKREKQAVERFIEDLKRPDLYIDYDDLEVVIMVANSLKHRIGPISGSPIYLLPWQIWHFMNLFALKYNDKHEDPELHGLRKYKKAFSFLARGSGKSQMAAIITICMLFLNEDGSPLCTSSAATREQASIVFEDIKHQIQTGSKSIKKRFKVMARHIEYKPTKGRIMATSSVAKNLDGKRILCGILDEIHSHPDSTVHDVIESSQGSGTAEPLLYMITTAGTDVFSYCRQVYDYCCELMDGIKKNDRYFVHIFEADENRSADDPIAWEQASPSYGHAVVPTLLKTDYLGAQMSPAAMAAFETKRLNRWHAYNENGFIDSELIEKCPIGFTKTLEDYEEGTEAFLGVDLAQTNDLSTVSILIPQDGEFHAFTKSFLPRVTFDKTQDSVKAIYAKAVSTGHLELTDGNHTNLENIHNYIESLSRHFDLDKCGIDPAAGGVDFGKKHYDQYSDELIIVSQGYDLSNAASRLLRSAFIGGFKFHKDDVLLAWALQNGRVKEGLKGDMWVHKPTNNNALKIDPLIATMIAISLVPVIDSTPTIR